VRGGAEWLHFGQVFPSATKSDRRPVGIEPLPAVAAASTVPVLAIGGIRGAAVAQVMAAGASGVAVISAVAGAPDPERAVRELTAALAAGPGAKERSRAQGR
jgi:thiamine-phosphate pyrophosphorylase